VEKWGDDGDDGDDVDRAAALAETTKKERSQKRKMYLDKWDSALDEGKVKKVRKKVDRDHQETLDPKDNPFHRIQVSMQKMKKGNGKRSFGNGLRRY